MNKIILVLLSALVIFTTLAGCTTRTQEPAPPANAGRQRQASDSAASGGESGGSAATYPPGFFRNWMYKTEQINNKPLREITIPASHDAATWGFLDEISPEKETKDLIDIFTKVDSFIDNFDGLPVYGITVHVSSGDRNSLKREAHSTIYAASRDLASATDIDIAKQLDAGVRWFDLRVFLRDGGAYTHHALTCVPIDPILDQVKNFVSNMNGEIVVLEMTHFIADKDAEARFDAFANNVYAKLGPYALSPTPDRRNNPFSMSYLAIVANPAMQITLPPVPPGSPPPPSRPLRKEGALSKVILIMDGAPKADSRFWSLSELGIDNTDKYSYANKDVKDLVIQDQLAKFNKRGAGDICNLWMTLTPQPEPTKQAILARVIDRLKEDATNILWGKVDDSVKKMASLAGVDLKGRIRDGVSSAVRSKLGDYSAPYSSIRELSGKINPDLQSILLQQFQPLSAPSNRISILYGDFVHNSKLVETAYLYSLMPAAK